MAGRLVLSVAVLVLSALLVLGSTTKAEPYHVTIGFTVSESGPYAAGSAGMREGLELWRDDVNARGGIRVGGVAHTVRFVTYNDASDPERVRDLYHRLITQDRVDFLVAPYSSSLGSVAVGEAAEHGMIILTSVVASDEVYHRGYSTVYQVLSPGSAYLEHAVVALAQARPDARLALLYKDDPFSRSVVDGARHRIADFGLQVVYDSTYPDSTTDFGPFVEAVAASGADALIGGGHFLDGVELAREIAARELSLDYLTIISAPSNYAFAELGDAALGVVYPSLWEPQVPYRPTFGPTPQAFAEAYRDRYGHLPDYHGAGGYAVGLTLQHALETAGSLDPHAVHLALDATDILTLSGRVKFSTDPADHGRQIGHRVLLVQWQRDLDGNLVKEVVWPPDVRTAELIFPKP